MFVCVFVCVCVCVFVCIWACLSVCVCSCVLNRQLFNFMVLWGIERMRQFCCLLFICLHIIDLFKISWFWKQGLLVPCWIGCDTICPGWCGGKVCVCLYFMDVCVHLCVDTCIFAMFIFNVVGNSISFNRFMPVFLILRGLLFLELYN